MSDDQNQWQSYMNDSGGIYRAPNGVIFSLSEIIAQGLPGINTIVLRAKNPDWVEIQCREQGISFKLDFVLTDYQKEQCLEKGQQILFPFRCLCGVIQFLTLMPTDAVCKKAPFIPTTLPPGVYNSGPSPF